MRFLDSLLTTKPQKKIAVLLDPGKESRFSALEKAKTAEKYQIDYLFVGGSTSGKETQELCTVLKSVTSIPIVLFPGNILQITDKADTLLLLSLISGRNPELLIGQHVTAAMTIRQSGLETVPVGYILIDGGKCSSTEYISGSRAIPRDKTEIVTATAVAGEMLGLKAIYLEAGSGAKYSVSTAIIKEVRKHINVPLIVGGGLRSPEAAADACLAGADLVVVGNIFEEDCRLTADFAKAIHALT